MGEGVWTRHLRGGLVEYLFTSSGLWRGFCWRNLIRCFVTPQARTCSDRWDEKRCLLGEMW